MHYTVQFTEEADLVVKKRDTSKKRNDILDAAVKAFQDEGYENTSMDRIAEIAGASKRTVYNHFPSKEILFKEVVNRFHDEIIALEQITYKPELSLEEQLAAFADVKISVAQNPTWLGLMKVTLGVFISHPELAEETMVRAKTGDDILVTWLEAAAADGRIRFKDAKLAATVFWSLASGAFFWPMLFQPFPPADQLQTLKTEVVETFLSHYRM